MSNAWGGSSQTLGYRGTRANQPPNCTFSQTSPTEANAKGYSIGDIWINEADHTAFMLLGLETDINNPQGGILADWLEIAFSAGSAVSFMSYLSTNQMGVTGDGTEYQVIFDQVSNNTGSAYDTVTGIFTAPADGIYSFQGSITIQTAIASGPNTLQGYMVHEGTYIQIAYQTYVSDDDMALSGSVTLQMFAGDEIYMSVIVTLGVPSGLAVNVLGAANPIVTYFSGSSI